MTRPTLDITCVRKYFPSLNSEWTFFDNAGGAQVPVFVPERIREYLLESNVQHGASYSPSQIAVQRTSQAITAVQNFIGAKTPGEIVIGASTTQLLLNLSLSLGKLLRPGDEIIVSNSDHEANIGPWINLQELGITIKFWKINPESYKFELQELENLLTSKTRLVALTHASNILGYINPIREITERVHAHGAWLCVDGVGFAAHRKIDIQELGADFYVFSFYKVFGPHLAMLYIKKTLLDEIPGINHFFLNKLPSPYKLQPGNFNFELTYGLLGIFDYFNKLCADHSLQGMADIFDMIACHEEHLSRILLESLQDLPGVKIVGSPDYRLATRLPIISFIAKKYTSAEIVRKTDAYKIGIRFGDFYARRLLDHLALPQSDGVVRISMAHYNTEDEVRHLIQALQEILR